MTIYTLPPSTTIIWRDRTPDGKPQIKAQPCDCSDRIPGLTAEFCKSCRTYWVDKWLELEIQLSKKNQGSSFDVNEGEASKRQSTLKPEDVNSAQIWGQETALGCADVGEYSSSASKGKNQGVAA